MVKKNYFGDDQPNLFDDMRPILIEGLMNIQFEFKLNHEVIFLAVNILDRYLAVQKTVKDELQKIGTAALLIASKMEVIYPPSVDTFVSLCANSFTAQALLVTEGKILSALNFALGAPTILHFLNRYLLICMPSEKTKSFAYLLAELALLDLELMLKKPSVIAKACIFFAWDICHYMKIEKEPWQMAFEKTMGFRENEVEQMEECMKLFCWLFQSQFYRPRLYPQKKYMQKNFNEVGNLFYDYSKVKLCPTISPKQ